ncbi:hypothetical protein [Shouchella lehensis]|uniref:Uncharacterized protein n=1 Tax=Shouchella lehensis TaxID=300825 RepID=A0A4Y7WII1_9BACI|nr:hypothetical protein [Shouchella lehensis]TES48056.1 hypothetical protein E2L03_13050 [Shouchella lehensis]
MNKNESHMLNKTWAEQKISLKEGAYVAGIQFNYIWTSWEKAEFKRLWKENRGLMFIAKRFNRRWEEVLVLAADLVDRGELKARERAFFQ